MAVYADHAGGSLLVGGSATQVQYNKNNRLTGNSGFVFDDATSKATLGDLIVSNLTVSLPVVTDGNKKLASSSYASFAGNLTHANLLSLSADDHTQYGLLAGRSTPQQFNLGTASGASTGYLSSTAHGTKGKYGLIQAGTIVVDEANVRLGIGVSSPGYALSVAGTFASADHSYDTLAQLTSTASTADSTGQRVTLDVRGNATHTSGTLDQIRGFTTYLNGSGNGGTTSTMSAFRGRVDAQTGHTITASQTLYVEDGTGSGTLTTQYGLYIESLTKGVTNRPIYCAGGDSIHVGKFRFGGTSAPSYSVDTTGDINASGVFRVGGTAGISGTFTLSNLLSQTFTGGLLTGTVSL